MTRSERIASSFVRLVTPLDDGQRNSEGETSGSEVQADHDLTVVGATRESELQQFVFGALHETVGQRTDSTVTMAKRNLGLTSRLARWLG